jgi:hypothetical protein
MEQNNQQQEERFLGMEDEELRIVDLNGAEVVRRQFLSHIKDSMVTFRPNGLQFNTCCIASFKNVTHVLLMVDWDNGWFIIKPCDPDDRDGQRWCVIKGTERKTRFITGKAFAERLYKKLGWCFGKSYKICGTYARQKDKQDEIIMVFEFKDAEDYMLTRKTRISAGVDDAEINAEDLSKLEEFEKQRELEKKEREVAKAEGREFKKSRKKNHFPEEWENSLGVKYEDHRTKIEFPHLPSDAKEAEQMGMSIFADAEGNEQNG